MKKTNLLFFSFAIIMVMVFVGCNTDCGEQNSNSSTKQFSITYENLLGADNSANPTSFTVKDKISLHDITIDEFYFNGWHDAKTAGNKVKGWNAGEKKNDVTLWANWIKNGIEDESGDVIINGVRYLKTSMVTVLDSTADFTCDLSKMSAFVTERGTIRLSPYMIGKYPVTQGLFNAVMGTNPSGFKDSTPDTKDGLKETDTLLRPVENVSWYDAIAFCNKLSLLLGKTPCYSVSGIEWTNLAYNDIPAENNDTWNDASCDFKANGYRLLSKAEWECAARGGEYSTTTPWTYKYAGSEDIDKVAWYTSNSNSHTWEVGLKQPNTLGLFDMSGNVWEWCWDWYNNTQTADDDKYKKDGVIINPIGPSSHTASFERVLRGGGWGGMGQKCELVSDCMNFPLYRRNLNSLVGFRIACSIR